MALERRSPVIDPPSHGGGDLFKRYIAPGSAIRKAASRRPVQSVCCFICSGDRPRLPLPAPHTAKSPSWVASGSALGNKQERKAAPRWVADDATDPKSLRSGANTLKRPFVGYVKTKRPPALSASCASRADYHSKAAGKCRETGGSALVPPTMPNTIWGVAGSSGLSNRG